MHNEDMVRLAGGAFVMGTDDGVGYAADGEGPVRRVTLSPFFIGVAAVTNADFAEFVAATGHRTDAERFGWSFVFEAFVTPLLAGSVERYPGAEWWCKVPGAEWLHPAGANSSIADLADHPVVHVSWRDAAAFADWRGTRLPTEAEWEYAARGGLPQQRYPWGDDFPRGAHAKANVFEGPFPTPDPRAHGPAATAPAISYPPNGYGLHNMVGNVWEWTADWWTADRGELPDRDPAGPERGEGKVLKGGSYLCHDSYCNRYRVAARTSNPPDTSTGHIGFRLAADA